MTLATVAGVPVRLHWSFLVFVAGFAVWTVATVGLGRLPFALGTVVALFGSVLVHELGHAGVASRLGIRTHEITLLPIGGAARMDLRSASPRSDLMVSFAGPAVSLALGAVLAGAGALLGSSAVALLGAVNLFLGVFNLIPAYPMDGGRILRAALTGWVGLRRATDWTLALGGLFSLAFVALGLTASELGLVALGVLLAVMQARERRALDRLR